MDTSEPTRTDKARQMLAASLRSFAASLVAYADVVETMEETSSPAGPRYYTRKSWIASGGEGREYDRAVQELRSFKAGRRRMILCDELHAWVEAHVRPPKDERPSAAIIAVTPEAAEWQRGQDAWERRHPGFHLRETDEERAAKGLPPYDVNKEYAAVLAWQKEVEGKRRDKELADTDPAVAAERAAACRGADVARRTPKVAWVRCTRCRREVRPCRRSATPVRHDCPHSYGDFCADRHGNDEQDGTTRCPWCEKERPTQNRRPRVKP